MSEYTHATPLDCGIAVIHSNQLEQLGAVLEYWLRQYPLAALEDDLVLVQSSGMGQWLKQYLAQPSALGISAGVSVQMPALFIWRAYRAVLGEVIPTEQALAKAPLLWRLYRLLPHLLTQPQFANLSRFLADDDDHRKRYQLAENLADIFDQYQVYRSDWLADWSLGVKQWRNAQGGVSALPDEHVWQADVWQAVLGSLDDTSTFASRSDVHRRFLAKIDSLEVRPEGLPRRIILFGLSSLPQQSLEVIAKLGKFCQIILFVHNPCQYFWADIIEDKELFKADRQRHKNKSGLPALLNDEQLHLFAPPLLAAWGKQGRDYIRLLDQFDNTARYANWHWPDNKIDVFENYGDAGQRSVLQRLQQSILDLEPIAPCSVASDAVDESVIFHVAHSPQREVEILHDQLLARFESAKAVGQPLFPRDVIVMVPDINQYAPHIRAVFGLFKPEDNRFIPFSIADQQTRGQVPLLVAVESLLNLSESRFTVSEMLDLLRIAPLRERFTLTEEDVSKLHQWIEESGIRWGLNGWQRNQTLGMNECLEANTWQFGLQRMLLGYAVGAGSAFKGIEPYQEIGGIAAQSLGGLCYLLEKLKTTAQHLSQNHSPQNWHTCLLTLLDDFFCVSQADDLTRVNALKSALDKWLNDCQLAGLTDEDCLPIEVVREAWLKEVDEPNLQQRFLTGRVNFCTLMPMRAIPFRVIVLLGMNDGDYPRNPPRQRFDLMSLPGQYRPGDRSRRQDDQYLFLEALLSARDQLYISWVGKSIRDNSDRPPSVLVSQLRDTLAQCAENPKALLSAMTVCHPLQPFSQAYVAKNRNRHLLTYSAEWFCDASARSAISQTVDRGQALDKKNISLTLENLARFLRAPVKTYCHSTLKFGFDEDKLTGENNEPFAFDGLQAYSTCQHLLSALKRDNPPDLQHFFNQQKTMMSACGQLPLKGFGQAVFNDITEPLQKTWEQYQTLLTNWPIKPTPHTLELPPFLVALAVTVEVELSGHLTDLHQNAQGELALIHVTHLKKLDCDKLLFYWVQHLSACTDHLPVKSFVIGAEAMIELPPLDPEEAYDLLHQLVSAYALGLQAPLPCACKSAFVWLEKPETSRFKAAKSRYEGDDWVNGERDVDRYLMRFYPEFNNLTAPTDPSLGDFAFWVERLYQPFYDCVKKSSTPTKARK